MKILLIQHKAGDRFRTVQYYAALQADGYEIHDPHWDIKTQWSQYLQKASEVDVIWIARRMLSFYKLRQLKKANPHTVFDFDDALFMRSSRHGSQGSFSKALKFKTVLKSVSQVVAGNDFLADKAGLYVPADKITVLPSVVNRDWYEKKIFADKEVLVMGWLGSTSTLSYLEGLKTVFEEFDQMKIPWKLKVISDVFPDWPHLPLEKISWTLEDEKKALSEIDLGLNPLLDDDWCRGKCAIKAIQYMAAGAAVALSPVGVNRLLLEKAEGSWSCDTNEKWLSAFKEAAQDKKRTFELGQKAKDSIWEHYTMEAQCDNLKTIFAKATR